MPPDHERIVLFDASSELSAPPGEVFAFIADHSALPRWIPWLRRVDVDVSQARPPGGVGTRRTIHMAGGAPGVEIVTAFEPPVLLAYSATDESLRGLCSSHCAEISCTPSAHGTLLRWTVRAKPSPSWGKRIAARLIFNLVCRTGMRKLRKDFSTQRVPSTRAMLRGGHAGGILGDAMTEVPLRCQCGLLRGTATDVSPSMGNRIVCYCDDCQAYARFLGREGIVDARGGTDVFQMTPSQVRITAGAEHLRCMRLSEKGLTRWFARCCKTPVGNTSASARVPFVGVVHCFMDHDGDGRSRDVVLGPPRALIQGRFALGGLPPHAYRVAPLGLIARSVRLLATAWLAGKSRPSPFFNPASGAPVVRPQVLTPTERDRLRPVT